MPDIELGVQWDILSQYNFTPFSAEKTTIPCQVILPKVTQPAGSEGGIAHVGLLDSTIQ